jgi:hypothetical protein
MMPRIISRSGALTVKPGQFLRWQDLFAVIDDGSISLAGYDPIESAMRAQARQCPKGIACMVILPPDARPPPDEIKPIVTSLFARLAAQLSCLAYVIEGTGFKAVAVRATLVGMRIFASRTYPIYVETTTVDAVKKVLPHLAMGKTVTTDVQAIAKTIAAARAVTA